MFDRVENVEISIDDGLSNGIISLSYRGVELDQVAHIELPVSGHMNILFGDAQELLRIDRSWMTDTGFERAKKTFGDTFRSQLPDRLGAARANDEDVAALSLSAFLELDEQHPAIGDEWRTVPYADVLLGELEQLNELHIAVSDSDLPPPWHYDANSGRLELPLHEMKSWVGRFLFRVFPGRVASRGLKTLDFKLSKTPGVDVDDAALSWILELNPKRRGRRNLPRMLACPSLEARITNNFCNFHAAFTKRMLSPVMFKRYSVSAPDLPAYVEWTVKHSAVNATHVQVAADTMKFIEKADQLMSEEWGEAKKYTLEDCRQQLAEWLESDDA